MAPRETENNAYAKFWGDKTKRSMVCCGIFCTGQWLVFPYEISLISFSS